MPRASSRRCSRRRPRHADALPPRAEPRGRGAPPRRRHARRACAARGARLRDAVLAGRRDAPARRRSTPRRCRWRAPIRRSSRASDPYVFTFYAWPAERAAEIARRPGGVNLPQRGGEQQHQRRRRPAAAEMAWPASHRARQAVQSGGERRRGRRRRSRPFTGATSSHQPAKATTPPAPRRSTAAPRFVRAAGADQAKARQASGAPM